MPFLNEGAEPARTIESIYDTCDPGMIDIIAIDDGSQWSLSDLSRFPDVKVVRNASRRGVAGCRQQGAELAQTPFLLIIDGHMRFRKDNWLDRIIAALEREPQTIFCTTCVRLKPEQMDMTRTPNKHYGAHLLLVNAPQFGDFVARQIIEAKWAEPREPDEYEIQCVLGANYAVTADWFNKIRGFQGLQKWGSAEPYLSLKSWLAGGKCKILKDIEIGHMFREAPPYLTQTHHMFYNKMWICKTLFPDDLTYRLLAFLPKGAVYDAAEAEIKADWRRVQEMRAYLQRIFTRSVYEVCDELGIWVPRGIAHDLFVSFGQPVTTGRPVSAEPVGVDATSSAGVIEPVAKETRSKTDVLNCVAAAIGAERYLEIGAYEPERNFDKIRCPSKVGVGPRSGAAPAERKTSDEFFADLPSSTGFDLIFVDGDHRMAQVRRDIDNALNHLNEGGVVVVHDVNPTAAAMALPEKPSPSAAWCGEAWKAFVAYRSMPAYSCATVDCDWGVGLIVRRANPAVLALEGAGNGHGVEHLTYDWLANHRQEALNLIAPNEQTIRRFLSGEPVAAPSPGLFSAIYYTDNNAPEPLLRHCFDQLSAIKQGGELIVVAQQPAAIFEQADHLTIVGSQPRSHLSMYRQILGGLETARHDRVFLVEHDVLYPEGYFAYRPPHREAFWYNENAYRMNNEGFFKADYLMTSNCCGDRDDLHRAIEQRIRAIEAGGRMTWAEPGVGGHDSFTAYRWQNRYPTIDVRHGANFTGDRAAPVYLGSIPYWGNHAALKAHLGL